MSGLLSVCTLAASSECSFRHNPDHFLSQEARVRDAVHATARRFGATAAAARGATVDPGEMTRRSFVDEFIFDAMKKKGIRSARLAGDEEFLRRIHLDLTGHPPSPAEIREFLASDRGDKRDIVIDTLLYSRKFMDRWAMWMGDLLQNVSFPQNFDRQYFGRNAYYEWILFSIAQEKNLRDMALDAVGGTGNSYDSKTGFVNFSMNGIAAMGPVQDTYDNLFKNAATVFLGLSNYDCLLCHDGRGHLEQVNLWGSKVTRSEAMRQAAFFARISMSKPRLAATEFYFNSYDVRDAQAGNYLLNTAYGNRPDRVPFGGSNILAPEYRDGRKAEGANWRQQFAAFLVEDPMFPVNLANRLWKEMFTMGLVEPIDALDPARLDPDNPPPGSWGLQPTHPELLRKLASEMVARNYSLREFLRLLVQSNAYQLSSRYDDNWKIDYVPLFARHYPRRLEGEEVHDALVMATGVQTVYRVTGLADTPWAMQLPETVEPRSNGASVNFMNPFYRGNRDSFFRIQDGSIQQQLNLMNDPFVLNRLRVASSPTLREAAAKPDEEAIEEIFLLFLQRKPDARERAVAAKFLSGAGGQRNAYLEDLAWSLVNKTDFLFNY